MTHNQVIIAIAVISLVTIAIRFIPFLLFNGKETPKVILHLGKYLPSAIMAMLVVYCLKGISFLSVKNFLPELVATAVVSVTYIIKRSTLLSIICGTIVYMLLVQLVFV